MPSLWPVRAMGHHVPGGYAATGGERRNPSVTDRRRSPGRGARRRVQRFARGIVRRRRPPEPVGSVATDPTEPETSALLLSEVGIDEPFVELANPGSEPADLAEASLVADGRPIDLPDTSPLDPGERRLVPVDDGVLDPAEGSVLLYVAGETLVDSVIWGAGVGGSVSLAVGDFASDVGRARDDHRPAARSGPTAHVDGLGRLPGGRGLARRAQPGAVRPGAAAR